MFSILTLLIPYYRYPIGEMNKMSSLFKLCKIFGIISVLRSVGSKLVQSSLFGRHVSYLLNQCNKASESEERACRHKEDSCGREPVTENLYTAGTVRACEQHTAAEKLTNSRNCNKRCHKAKSRAKSVYYRTDGTVFRCKCLCSRKKNTVYNDKGNEKSERRIKSGEKRLDKQLNRCNKT